MALGRQAVAETQTGSRVAAMTAERVRYWKDEFERAFRAGDRDAMAYAEQQIEAWRLWDSLKAEEQEELLHERQVRL